MKEALFRPEAIEAGRHRLSGTVVASVPPSSRAYTTLVLVVFAAVAMLLLFGSYAGGAAVRGAVEYDTGLSRVHAPSAGELRALHVRQGQEVAAGTPLATVSMAQGPRGLALQMAELDAQVAEIDRQLGLADAGAATDRVGLDQQRASLRETIASLDRQRTIARGQVALAERAVGRTGRLAREGAGSQRQEEEARADLLARRAAVEALDERIIATRATLADTERRLRRVGIEAGTARSELAVRRAVLAAQADTLRRSDSLVVTAPIAGVVADLPVRPGQRVAAEASVATLVPRGGSLQVHLYAPSRAIGFARVGQPVRLRFDAFPYQKYGAARGTVLAVSPVAVDPASLDPALELREPVFRVKVRMEPLPGTPALKPGTTLTADLLMERRPLWALLFGSLRETVRK